MQNFLPFIITCGILLIIVARAYIIRQDLKKRAASLQGIADKLGIVYTEEDPILTEQVKDLMEGKNSAKVFNSLQFEQDGHELNIMDYSHIVKSGKSSTRVYYTAVAIPIKHDHIPLFYVQPSKLTDRISHWFNWPEVEIFGNDQFNRKFGLKTKPEYVAEVQQYFDAHQQLAGLCERYPTYRLATDGKWLVWYIPHNPIKANIDELTAYLDQVKELLHALELNGGKSAAWGSYDDNQDSWGSDYDSHLKQLKDDQ